MSFFQNLGRSRKPLLLSAFGLFQSTNLRSKSSYVLRTPPPNVPREIPTPLVFLSAQAWDPDSATGMTGRAAMFAEKGYTCLEVDLSPPEPSPATAEALLEHFENELKSHIRLAAIPFPPVMVARSTGGSLIAQTYISSHPASGLILISPPPSNVATTPLLPTPLKQDFDFEPRFPLLIVDTPRQEKEHRQQNRLVRDHDVEMVLVENLEGQEALRQVELWLDESGF